MCAGRLFSPKLSPRSKPNFVAIFTSLRNGSSAPPTIVSLVYGPYTSEVRISVPPVGTRGMVLGEATVELLTPCSRMVQLLDTPQDVPFFCKLLQREIIYRLLQGPQGDRLRSVATMPNQSYLPAKAASWPRKNFEKP